MTLALIQAPSEDEDRASIGAPGLLLGGKYRLEEAIARGGMARVWRARHVTLNRPVAVKFVEGAGEGQERIDRFLREAKVAASVRHKNVVDILDFGVFDGRSGDAGDGARDAEPYMVMELLEGETLGDLIARGPLEIREAIDIALQLLSGLDAVHRAGIVHRDLKPGNVFLTHDHDGTFARLLDFGISQGAEEAEASTPLIVGTPEYMSPEQAMGAPLDARADLYSIGVILYEMLSGRVPFEHEDGQQVLEMVVADTPIPVVKLRPDAPQLSAVVDVAMSRFPESRYETARDMRRAILEASGLADTTERTSLARDLRPSGTRRREDLITMPELAPAIAEAVTDGPSDASFVAPRPRERRWMLGVVALLGVALVGALGIIVTTRAPEPAPAAADASAPVPEVAAAEASAPVPEVAPAEAEAPVGDVPVDTIGDVVEADTVASDAVVAAPAIGDATNEATEEAATETRPRRRRGGASEPVAEPTEPAAPAEVAPPRAVVTDLDF